MLFRSEYIASLNFISPLIYTKKRKRNIKSVKPHHYKKLACISLLCLPISIHGISVPALPIFSFFKKHKTSEMVLHKQHRKKPLKATLYISHTNNKAQIIHGTLQLDIDPHWHINNNQPTHDFLIPTKITLLDSTNVDLTRIHYPKPKKMTFPYLEKPVLIYENTVYMQLTFKKKSAKPASIKVKLSYQPCEDTQCLPPDKLILSTTI